MPGNARLAAWTAALLAGLLQAASIAWPWGGQPQWWLQLASLAVLCLALRRETSPWHGALLGWLFAIAWLAGTWWWLYISMHVYGGLHPALTVLAVLGLAAFLGLYYALAAGLFVRWGGVASPWAGAALFACLWLGAELLRGTLFTGFPWGAGGYAHVDGPLAFLAPWVGVYAMGTVASWIAAALAFLLVARAVKRLAATLASVAVIAAAGHFVGPMLEAPGAGRLSVALLQGNIPQDEKFQGGTGIPLALDWYAAQLRDTRAALVVAPETAIPLLPRQLPDGYLASLRAAFSQGDRAALTGMPLGSLEEGYTNSVIGMKPGTVYQYDKHHLVPFGEFIPPLFKWFTRMMNIPLGDFNRGDVGQSSFEWQGQRLAPNICYEDLFGEELGARFGDAATAPTIFVNVSNIAWFGNTVAIDQHLHISRMRALEFHRPMVRATNTGATVIIDRRGVVTHSLPRHTRGVLVGEVEGGTGITPFAWWVARFGLWPLWLLALGVPALAAVRHRRISGPSAPAAPAGPA